MKENNMDPRAQEIEVNNTTEITMDELEMEITPLHPNVKIVPRAVRASTYIVAQNKGEQKR
jgi:hypothetical protein